MTNVLTTLMLPASDVILRATLLLGLTGVAALLLGRASAATRHWVWTLGLLGALALPVLSVSLPRWELAVVTIESKAAPAARTSLARETEPPAATALVAPAVGATRGSDLDFRNPANTTAPDFRKSRSDPWSFAGLALIVWLAGAAAILGRLVLGLLAVQWMTRRLERVADASWLPLAEKLAASIGLRRKVMFLRGRIAAMPMACGIWRPRVVMPADADAWPASRLRIVLLHELAHVKRRDCLTHALAQLACAVYWFNPLAWIAARRIRAERERACDDLVLAAGTRGSDYANQLLEVARAMRGDRFPSLLAGATLAMAHRTQLEGRLLAILDQDRRRSGLSAGRRTAAVTLAACAVMPLATLQPWAYTERADDVLTYQGPSRFPSQAPEPAPAPLPDPDPTPVPGGAPDDVAANDQERRLEPEQRPEVVVGRAVHDTVTTVVGSVLEGVVAGVLDGVLGATQEIGERRASSSDKRLADPRAIAALTEALKDVDVEVREAALTALIQLRHADIYEPLVAALADASDDIRELAAMGLGRLGDLRSLEALAKALDDRSASVREQAIFALGRLKDKRSAAPLARALKDESPSVREQAAFALGQLRDPGSLDALAAALQDSSADVREMAAFALGQMRDSRAVRPLISALKDSNADVRHHAAFGLGQLRDPSAVEPLVIAMKDANADVRAQVAFALGQLGDPRAVDALTAALKDASADVRQMAAFALGQLAR
jgi:HEAT repeat protein/beta-lactamase regulating signal transducer with metallopeptidase domain